MKAVVLREIGGPEKFAIEEIPTPEPGANEVRVKLKASALNRRDFWISMGMYPGMKFPAIAGSDGAGVVEKVGSAADKSLLGTEVVVYPAREWGDNPVHFGSNFRVLGMPDQGTFAEYICAPAADVYARPAHLSWEQAAAVPLAGLTSWRAVVTQAQVKKGDRVLVTGASSGVSTFAIQWAASLGAEVYVTSGSAEKIAKAKAMGAKDGLSYRDDDCYKKLRDMSGGFDAIIDSAGGDAFNEVVDSLAGGGRYVFFGATMGNSSIPLNLPKLFFKHGRIQGTTMGTPAEFQAMLNFVTERKIIPVVDRVMPMSEVVAAHKLMESFSQSGKIVLRNE